MTGAWAPATVAIKENSNRQRPREQARERRRKGEHEGEEETEMVFIASRRQSEVYKHDTPGQKGPAPPHLHRFTVYHATRSAPQCRRGAHRIASLYRLISRTRDGNLFLRQTFPWFQLQVVASASTPCHPFAKHADRMDRGSRRIESALTCIPPPYP